MKLCECGCGGALSPATRNTPRYGIKKGEYRRFLRGHQIQRKNIDQMYVVDANTGCWNWIGHRDSGYGRIGSKLAYRLTYERAKGTVPNGLRLDHLCRNRACVNPEHLEPVTHAENCRRGANCRLTLEDVRKIRSAAARGGPRGYKTRLARQFGVGPTLIHKVIAGTIWRDVAQHKEDK